MCRGRVGFKPDLVQPIAAARAGRRVSFPPSRIRIAKPLAARILPAMKHAIAMVTLLGMLATAPAQPGPSAEPDKGLPLWSGGTPGALGAEPKDIPTLTPYLPDGAGATGAAIVICPGGGLRRLGRT